MVFSCTLRHTEQYIKSSIEKEQGKVKHFDVYKTKQLIFYVTVSVPFLSTVGVHYDGSYYNEIEVVLDTTSMSCYISIGIQTGKYGFLLRQM